MPVLLLLRHCYIFIYETLVNKVPIPIYSSFSYVESTRLSQFELPLWFVFFFTIDLPWGLNWNERDILPGTGYWLLARSVCKTMKKKKKKDCKADWILLLFLIGCSSFSALTPFLSGNMCKKLQIFRTLFFLNLVLCISVYVKLLYVYCCLAAVCL